MPSDHPGLTCAEAQELIDAHRAEIVQYKSLVLDLDKQADRMGVILNRHVPNWMTYPAAAAPSEEPTE